jgi:hypothetical protein
MANDAEQSTRQEKANTLVVEFGKRFGVANAKLDSNNDRSFGDFGFYYDSAKNLLIGRVLISKAFSSDDSPEIINNFRKVAVALNAAEIGGMFERGGGYFILDETKRMYFFVKEYDINVINHDILYQDMNNLIGLGATWTIRWFARVADITHGHELAPTKRVTRQNDK